MDVRSWREHQRRLRVELRELRAGGDAAPPPAPALASVIVVCRDAEEVLGRCLQQLLAQDHPDYEVIVVDDASSDRTAAIAERHAGVRLVRSPRHRGCPHARNLGIREARGEIVAFVDADGYAAPDWLSRLTAALAADERAGAAASTVFLAGNPLVLNGAGGTVNRQGWAADLGMAQSYEHAEIAPEALYAMGCGMAFTRETIERVGPFDDAMLNYYDDVDYGIRVWRAGRRVIVAADAFIDHDFQAGAAPSAQKAELCERHRMRVVLKNARAGALAAWLAHELRELSRAPAGARARKLRAALWNLRRLPGVLASRMRARGAPHPPQELIDPSWGDGFPAGLPELATPRPDGAGAAVAMGTAAADGQLLYGWFPRESSDGRSYRWGAARAGVLVELAQRAERMRLDFAHAPVDTGSVDVALRRVGDDEELATASSLELPWQFISRSVENYPTDLPAGLYEVSFAARRPWTDPPRETRALGLALAELSFHAGFEVPPGGLDMSSPLAREQLVAGWYEPEQDAGRTFRWAGARGRVVVRLPATAARLTIDYRVAPTVTQAPRLTIGSLAGAEVWSGELARADGEWHTDELEAVLGPGTYLVTVEAARVWSNADGADAALPPENRSLGVAVSSLGFAAGGRPASPGGGDVR